MITQEKLSELIDLNIRSLQRIEAGQLNILLSTLLRIQQSLKCQWGELMPENTERPVHDDSADIKKRQ
jgi:transcriptional regulator with XRE-family HTH domain